jgi:hypothetical protein
MPNMVMDSTDLIPAGFHPVKTHTEDGIYKKIVCRTRTEVAPVKYYFTDFGLAVMYPSFDRREKLTGDCGQHHNIPELSDDIPYDPFKLDNRQMGETIKKEFEISRCMSCARYIPPCTDRILKKYWGLECLIPLPRLLQKDVPKQRPDASNALRRFQMLAVSLDSSARSVKLIERKGFQPAHRANRALASLAYGLVV